MFYGKLIKKLGLKKVINTQLPHGVTAQMRTDGENDYVFIMNFTQEEKVRSNRPVQLTRGNDRFTADTMEYDNLDQVLQLNGRVRGVLMPTPAK